MGSEQIKNLAAWLDKLDSHAVYTDELLKELLQFGIAYHKQSRTLVQDGISFRAPVYESDSIKKSMEERGLGGWMKEGEWLGVTGWDLANTLCRIVGVVPESKLGRGSQFRAALAALSKRAEELAAEGK